jgi:hypothetical protein
VAALARQRDAAERRAADAGRRAAEAAAGAGSGRRSAAAREAGLARAAAHAQVGTLVYYVVYRGLQDRLNREE